MSCDQITCHVHECDQLLRIRLSLLQQCRPMRCTQYGSWRLWAASTNLQPLSPHTMSHLPCQHHKLQLPCVQKNDIMQTIVINTFCSLNQTLKFYTFKCLLKSNSQHFLIIKDSPTFTNQRTVMCLPAVCKAKTSISKPPVPTKSS